MYKNPLGAGGKCMDEHLPSLAVSFCLYVCMYVHVHVQGA